MTLCKKALLTLIVLFIVHLCMAQKRDSMPQKVMAYVADKFPSTRVVNVEYTQLMHYQFSSKLNNTDLPDNKVDRYYQLKANTNINLLKTKKWLLGAAFNYKYTSTNLANLATVFAGESNDKANFHYHSESISATYFSKLWHKMAIYSATIAVDGSEQHFERIRGIVSASLLLKANARTKMTLGLAVFIDPSTQVPAIPIFTYEHRFNSGWIADVILPKKVLMKKDVFNNGRISFGSEMENNSFYIYHSNKAYEMRQVEINSGIVYEHKVGAFIGTFKSGVKLIPNARIFEKTSAFKDYFFAAKPQPAFYFNVGISYNPFGKIGKK